MSEKYDIAVIGYGHQGLTAAALLARDGARVAVFDVTASDTGSGAYELFSAGTRTGPCAHIPVSVDRGIADALGLENHGWTLKPEQTCTFIPTGANKGEYLFATSSRQATQREIAKFSPKDASAYMAVSDQLFDLAQMIGAVADAPPAYDTDGWKDVWGVFETAKHLSGNGDAQALFAQAMNGSLDQFLKARFESNITQGWLGLQATLAAQTAPTKKGSAASLLDSLLMLGDARPYRGDWQPLKGSLHRYITALNEAATASGAVIDINRTVDRLDVDAAGRITHAVLNDGTKIEAGMFIADTNPLVLFDTLIGAEKMPHEMSMKLASMRQSSNFVRIKLAAKSLPRFSCLTGFDDESFLSGDILVCPSVDYLSAARTDARSEGGTQNPAISMIIPSIAAPELCSPGHHAISIVAQYFDADALVDAPDNRNMVAEAVVRVIENLAPGFMGEIETAAVYMGDNLDRSVGPLSRPAMGAGHPLAQLFAASFGHHAFGYSLPFENLVLGGYGPEASASSHVNRGGVLAAQAAQIHLASA